MHLGVYRIKDILNSIESKGSDNDSSGEDDEEDLEHLARMEALRAENRRLREERDAEDEALRREIEERDVVWCRVQDLEAQVAVLRARREERERDN